MRLVFFFMAGIGASLGLFYLMANLISSGKKPLNSSSEQVSIDLVRVKRDSDTDTRSRKLPKKPPPPQKAPPVPKTEVSTAKNQAQTEPLDLEMPAMDLGLAGGSGPFLGRGGGGTGRSDETPLVRIEPEYPMKARMKGIEGRVKVEFNIGKTGSPINVEIIESDPPRVFDRAVRKAVLRWKYRPRVVDGKPIDSPDRLSVVFPFQFTEEEE